MVETVNLQDYTDWMETSAKVSPDYLPVQLKLTVVYVQ